MVVDESSGEHPKSNHAIDLTVRKISSSSIFLIVLAFALINVCACEKHWDQNPSVSFGNSYSSSAFTSNLHSERTREINGKAVFSGRTCNLHIYVDHLLHTHIFQTEGERNEFKTRRAILDLINVHVMKANHIFDATDFNGIQNINFIVEKITNSSLLMVPSASTCVPKKLKKGAICSPSEGRCCSSTSCSLYPKLHVCQKENACTVESVCNGLVPECPAPNHKPEGHPCEGGKCFAGVCKESETDFYWICKALIIGIFVILGVIGLISYLQRQGQPQRRTPVAADNENRGSRPRHQAPGFQSQQNQEQFELLQR